METYLSRRCASAGPRCRLLAQGAHHQHVHVACWAPMHVRRVQSAGPCAFRRQGPLRPITLVAASATDDAGELAAVRQTIKACEEDLKKLELGGTAWAALQQTRAALEARQNILLQQAAGGATSAVAPAGDDGRLYTGVTLYVLSQGQKGYSTLKKNRTTRKQLQAMWDKYGYDLAIPVGSKPEKLLTIDTAPGCTDMGSIDLEDGIQLAVVMHQPLTYMDMLHDKVTENTNLAVELRGFKDNIVAEQENVAAAWALQQLKTEPGARVFCIKEVAKAVELDGAAYSDVSAVVVERKQTFRYSDLESFVVKLANLKKLIELGAANTEVLYGKELRAYVMAGSWSGSTDEQAAMVQLMDEQHIKPIMPDGSAYQMGWGCNPHKPGASSVETAACAQRFL